MNWAALLYWVWLQPTQPEPLDARLERAIEWTESGDVATVRNGANRGIWQVNPRYATPLVRANPDLLYVKPVCRAEGRRMLRMWLRSCGGNLRCALASYNCGWGGTKGTCGQGYASTVLRRAKEAHWSVDYVAEHCRACPECCFED